MISTHDALSGNPKRRAEALRWMNDPWFADPWFDAAGVDRVWMLEQVTRRAA